MKTAFFLKHIKRWTAGILSAALLMPLFVTPSFAENGKENSKSKLCTTVEEIHQAFPESYWGPLDELKKTYPNWNFQAFYTDLTWDECFTKDSELYISRNLVQKNTQVSSWYSTVIPGSFNWADNSWVAFDSEIWYQASEEAIKYQMDPRNWMSEEQIFQFETLDIFVPGESTLKCVQGIFGAVNDGTGNPSMWVSKKIYSPYSKKDVSYAEAIYEIGELLGISPSALATRVVQEQGNGTSPLISGAYKFVITKDGEEKGKEIEGGYYNYFNIGSSGQGYEEIYNNGLTEAYYGIAFNGSQGWKTPYDALYGGAKKYRDNYLGRGQNSVYMQKFNVNYDSGRMFWGQYMQALITPRLEATKLYNTYKKNGILSEGHVFMIPVYNEMPESRSEEPVRDGNPNYKIGSVYIAGSEVPGFNADVTEYSMTVSAEDYSVRVNALPYAYETSDVAVSVNGGGAIVQHGSFADNINLNYGDNEVLVTCIAENGDRRTYAIHVYREGGVTYGDVNGDGSIDLVDIVLMRQHILEINTLSGSMAEAADIDGNGAIDLVDIVIIRGYLMGTRDSVPQR